ncbi:GTPase [Candidatus Woesearchaeota archaeon]|nr:GTPase [Candidatus Woesearchaeota archaeon]
MVKNFWKIVNQVIKQADIIVLLLDARLINETRNLEIETKVKKENKPLIYVITKCDLVDKRELEKISLRPSVFISAKKHLGTTILRNRILLTGKKRYGNMEFFTIGVLGYPNVGKSSLINAMKGKRSAPTSSTSGFTKGVQKIRADNKLVFLDTPGVIPYKEKDSSKHVLIGTIDFNRAKDPERIVVDLMERYPGQIEDHYGVQPSPDFEHSIELIAKKRNLLMKQNKPDTERASRMILKDWQTGKMRLLVG